MRIATGASLAVAVALPLVLSGCAGVSQQKFMSTQQRLSAAGFHMMIADSSSRQSYARGLPQQQVVPQQSRGKLKFVFADVEHCNCYFIGNEADYQRYQALTQQEKVARMQRDAARANRDAAYRWRYGWWGRPYWRW